MAGLASQKSTPYITSRISLNQFQLQAQIHQVAQ